MGKSPANMRPSGNWLALKKTAVVSKSKLSDERPRKRRRTEDLQTFISADIEETAGPSTSKASTFISRSAVDLPANKNGESLLWLRNMIMGQVEYPPTQQTPGKYLALDCEMVGVGINGSESSLARVSLVNYYGAVQLDEFVRQRERVVDYRTQYSGIRPADMVNAKPFNEVQERVAELLKDRILVGHAIFNDLKALLLSHPGPQTRDTQHLAGKHKLTPSRFPALRKLVEQELGMIIQSGEHSSVTDARATMAMYRLHRREWERGMRMPLPEVVAAGQKRKKDEGEDDEEGGEEMEFSGGGRKGISSRLSVVVKRSSKQKSRARGSKEGEKKGGKAKKSSGQWWKQLGDGGRKDSKGSLSMRSS